MKRLLLILILSFNFQSWACANDIKDFEIEGIALEDSALKYFDEKTIKRNSRSPYKDNKYTVVQNDKLPHFETYDFFDFRFFTNDKKYIMQSIAGIIDFSDIDYSECLKLRKDISENIKSLVPNLDMEIHDREETSSSKGYYDQTTFYSDDGNIGVTCYNYEKFHNFLSVTISNKEYEKYLISGPYN